jgi:hypothetical protein
MKDKVYLKISRTSRGNYKYSIHKKKNYSPMDDGGHSNKVYFPTILIGLNLEISDKHFKEAIADLDLRIENPEFASDIKVNEQIEEEKMGEIRK